MHERLGNHINRDLVILYDKDTINMAADIYAKSLGDPQAWSPARKLINAFSFLEPSGTELTK